MSTRILVVLAMIVGVSLAAFAPAVVIQIIVRSALVVAGVGLAVVLRPREPRIEVPLARVAR